MIVRIWTTGVEQGRAADYEAFARDISLPMFRQQAGYRGVLMGRRNGDCVVISLWEDEAALATLDQSPSYQATVQRILAEGFLMGEQTVEAYDLHLLDLATS